MSVLVRSSHSQSTKEVIDVLAGFGQRNGLSDENSQSLRLSYEVLKEHFEEIRDVKKKFYW